MIRLFQHPLIKQIYMNYAQEITQTKDRAQIYFLFFGIQNKIKWLINIRMG